MDYETRGEDRRGKEDMRQVGINEDDPLRRLVTVTVVHQRVGFVVVYGCGH